MRPAFACPVFVVFDEPRIQPEDKRKVNFFVYVLFIFENKTRPEHVTIPGRQFIILYSIVFQSLRILFSLSNETRCLARTLAFTNRPCHRPAYSAK